jgi:hypothetical protein
MGTPLKNLGQAGFFIVAGGPKEADREVRPTRARPMGTPLKNRMKLAL